LKDELLVPLSSVATLSLTTKLIPFCPKLGSSDKIFHGDVV